MSAPAITVPQANPGAGYAPLRHEIDAAVARRLAIRLVHPRPGGTRIRGRVRRLAGRRRRGRLRQRHRRAGARVARAGRRAWHQRGDRVAHRGRHRRRHRDGGRHTGAHRHRARSLHDGSRRTGRGARASACRCAADPRGDPGAPLRPAGGARGDRRGLPSPRGSGGRGLRAGARRHHRRPQGGHVHRARHLQLLPDQEPGGARRRRHGGDAGREARRRHRGAAAIRLAHPLHQRCGRREQPARRIAGRGAAREARPPRCAECPPADDRRNCTMWRCRAHP